MADQTNLQSSPTTEPVAPAASAPIATDLPVGTVTKLPHSGSSKKAKFFLILFLLVVLGCGLYYFTHKKNQATKASVMQDIPLLRYSAQEKGWNSFYPGSDNSNSFNEANRNLFEGLVAYQNKTKIVPLLATGWTNPDNNTWVFTLKSNVKFHTGRVMTAQDVKDSFEAAKSSVAGEVDATTIKTIEVLSPTRLKITTDGPDPILLNKLTTYYVFDTKSGKPNDPINGTGPFEVKPGTVPADTLLKMVAFDAYHGGHVHVRELDFTYIDDNVAKQFNDNKVDFANTSGEDISAVTRTHNILAIEPLSTHTLGVNSRRPGPLQNVKVRSAIQLALDIDALNKVRHEHGVQTNQLIPSGVPGYNPSIPKVSRDITKAKALLSEAGYPNGCTLTLTYYAPSQASAEEYARELKQVGITLKLDPQSQTKSLADKALGGKTDLFFISISSDYVDASDIFGNYLHSSNYQNPAIDKLLAQASVTLDATARNAILENISAIAAADNALIPVYNASGLHAIYPSNYVAKKDIPGQEIGVYFWKIYAR